MKNLFQGFPLSRTLLDNSLPTPGGTKTQGVPVSLLFDFTVDLFPWETGLPVSEGVVHRSPPTLPWG